MKKLILTPVLALLFAAGSVLTAQNWPDEYLGLPGDNLNLYAVMNLFQNAETLEAFERELNNSENMINNLDLNGDNYVDYIMVFDYQEGNVHNIVLRVALNQREHQDVAVFTVERFRDNSVQIQLIGDEALYGRNYIVEPVYAETPNPGYRGNVAQQRASAPRNVTVVQTTYYEVATWPVIVYMSRPVYRPWRSAWYWGYYPTYWHPWTPHYWHYYYGYHYNWHSHYYAHYRPWRHHRCGRYHTTYVTNIRHHSPTVIVNVNQGVYRDTYSRPESRREGEVLYTQRHSSGSTVPNNRSNAGGRQAASSVDGATPTNVQRTATTGRSGAVNEGTGAAGAGRSETQTTRRQDAGVQGNARNAQQSAGQAGSARGETNAAVNRQNTSTGGGRPAQTPSVNEGSRTPVRSNNDVVPARNTQQPTQQARPAAPANNNRNAAPATQARPAQSPSRNAAPAVQSAPAQRSSGSSAPASQARPAQSPSRNAAPAVQSAPAQRSSGSSAPATQARPAQSPSRNAAPAVQSAPAQRSSNSGSRTAVQSSGNQRSSSPSSAPARSGNQGSSSPDSRRR